MSVDPFIQAPSSTQSINPYSYIMNNPLAGTDPTGYVSKCDQNPTCQMQSFFSSVGSGGSSLIGNLMGRLKTTLSNGHDSKQTTQKVNVAAEIKSPATASFSGRSTANTITTTGGVNGGSAVAGNILKTAAELARIARVSPAGVIITGLTPTKVGNGELSDADLERYKQRNESADDSGEKENIREPSDSDYDPTKGSFDTEHIGKNPPKGEANSHSDANNKNGNKKQRRFYGPDGLPIKDIDLDHYHDGIKPPHVHDWFPNPNGDFPKRDEANVRKPTLEELDGI